jgi:hypothetical protein
MTTPNNDIGKYKKRRGSNSLGMSESYLKRRIVRVGDVLHMHGLVPPSLERVGETFIRRILRNALLMSIQLRRRTYGVDEIVQAMKLEGVTVLGYSSSSPNTWTTAARRTTTDKVQDTATNIKKEE